MVMAMMTRMMVVIAEKNLVQLTTVSDRRLYCSESKITVCFMHRHPFRKPVWNLLKEPLQGTLSEIFNAAHKNSVK